MTQTEINLIKKHNEETKEKRKLPDGTRLMESETTNYTPLYNIGNSCYMNSAIQLLFGIPEFITIIKNQDSDSNGINALKLLAEYFKGGSRYVRGNILNIDDIREKLSITISNNGNNNNMKKAKQISLEEELKKQTIYNQLYLQEKYIQVDTAEFILLKIFDLLDENHIFIDLFGFRPDEEILCKEGEPTKIVHPKQHFEKTLQITLYNEEEKKTLVGLIMDDFDIDGYKTDNLQSYIKESYNSEFYGPNDQPYRCTIQGYFDGNSHRIVSYNTKKYIIINLKRFFSYDPAFLKTGIHNKNSNPITRKLKFEIEPNPVIMIDRRNAYKLKSCIIHIGERSNGGHYIYLNFDDQGKPLHIIDDNSVYLYDGETNHSHNYKKYGYVYLYELIPP